MGKFDQVEFDSLAPYEQKQYEIDNPRPKTPRGEGMEARMSRFFANVSDNMEGKEKIDKNLETYRAKVGSDAGGRSIRGGSGFVGSGTVDLERGMRGSSTKPKTMKKGGKVKSASARADGIAIRGKTRA